MLEVSEFMVSLNHIIKIWNIFATLILWHQIKLICNGLQIYFYYSLVAVTEIQHNKVYRLDFMIATRNVHTILFNQFMGPLNDYSNKKTMFFHSLQNLPVNYSIPVQ